MVAITGREITAAGISKLRLTVLTTRSLMLFSSWVRCEPNGLTLACLKIVPLVSSMTRSSEKFFACCPVLYLTFNLFVMTGSVNSPDFGILNVNLVDLMI